MIYVTVMVGNLVQQDVREWYPSTIGPLFHHRSTIARSLFAPGQEVLYKQYHTGELVGATILGPSKERDEVGFVPCF